MTMTAAGVARKRAAVELERDLARIADGRAEDGAHDIQFRSVVGGHLRAPRRRHAAAGVTPDRHLRRRLQAERVEGPRGPDAVEHPVTRFAGAAEAAVEAETRDDRRAGQGGQEPSK